MFLCSRNVLVSLLKAIIFQLNLQISVLQHQTAFQRFQLELDDVSRERHDEVLDMSRMSESEREVRR
jgi:hypothetical protein